MKTDIMSTKCFSQYLVCRNFSYENNTNLFKQFQVCRHFATAATGQYRYK